MSSGRRRGEDSLFSFAAGALSALSTTLLFQPFDLVKTRMQSHYVRLPEASSATGSMPGALDAKASRLWGGPMYLANSGGSVSMFNVVESVVRKETVAGLWKGISPSLQRCVPSIGMYFAMITYLRRSFSAPESGKLGPLQSLSIGASARMIATGSFLPFIVVKTRYESGQYCYRSVSHAFVSIWRTEGVRGLFSGMGATLARDAPFSALYLMFYTQLKQLLSSVKGLQSDAGLSPVYALPCGLAAGTMASVITQPFDVVKTHMQLKPQVYPTFRYTFRTILSSRGMQGLFVGIAPRVMRRTFMAAFTWTFYEQIYCYLKWMVNR